MCSITNTAHLLSASFSSLASPQPTSSSLSSVLSCLLVVILSCLYVVGRHSLVLTDLMLKGACNQGRKVEDFYSGEVTRRHSLGECVLTTLLKSTFKKKELPYESFSTFLCQTLKRIYPRIVEDNWKRSKCRITTQPVFFHKPMKEYQQA